jgi:hypothetical protein
VTEAELLSTVRDACRWSGVMCYHVFDSRRSEPGYPDLTLVGLSGVVFRELKSSTGRLTPAQRTWLDRLNAAGADAAVWRPDSWPDRVLTELAGVGGRCLSRSGSEAAS